MPSFATNETSLLGMENNFKMIPVKNNPKNNISDTWSLTFNLSLPIKYPEKQ